MAPHPPHPKNIPSLPSANQIRHPNLPPQHRLQSTFFFFSLPLFPSPTSKKTKKTGEICLDLLNSSSTSTSASSTRSTSGWTPVYTLASTLEAVHMLLQYPDVESPLNVDVAVLLRNGDRVGAEGLVRWCCWEWRWEGDGEGGGDGDGRIGR